MSDLLDFFKKHSNVDVPFIKDFIEISRAKKYNTI